MPYYEHVFLMRQDLAPQQVEAIIDQHRKIVEDAGGQVTKVENWGLRNLAYRIRKYRKAHYVLLNIDAPAAAVQELERIENLSDDVIRFLTVRVDELEEGPSAMMRRDERGRGPRRDGRGPRRDERPAPAAKKEAAEEKEAE